MHTELSRKLNQYVIVPLLSLKKENPEPTLTSKCHKTASSRKSPGGFVLLGTPKGLEMVLLEVYRELLNGL